MCCSIGRINNICSHLTKLSCEATVNVFEYTVVFTFHILFHTARDAYLVSTLTDIQSKLDCIMRIVSRMSADSMPVNPDLPNDIVLPVANLHDLEAVEQALANSTAVSANSTAVKDSMVSYIKPI